MGDATPRITVLVIDDALPTRERLCALIREQSSATVVGCPARREEVDRLLTDLKPRCVVIDVPVHDPVGFALLASVRRAVADGVVIVLTNHETEELRRRSAELGVDHFLMKSLEFERVGEIVRALEERP